MSDWTTADADPIADIRRAVESIQSQWGREPDVLIVSPAQMDELRAYEAARLARLAYLASAPRRVLTRIRHARERWRRAQRRAARIFSQIGGWGEPSASLMRMFERAKRAADEAEDALDRLETPR